MASKLSFRASFPLRVKIIGLDPFRYNSAFCSALSRYCGGFRENVAESWGDSEVNMGMWARLESWKRMMMSRLSEVRLDIVEIVVFAEPVGTKWPWPLKIRVMVGNICSEICAYSSALS